jgi:hypothetical protein
MMTGAARDGFIDTLVIQLEGSDRQRTLVSNGELTFGKGILAGAADSTPIQTVDNVEGIDQLQEILFATDRPLPGGAPDKTCRAVGERLHALGGFELMQSTLANFADQHPRGKIAAAELSRCWDHIGANKDGSVTIGNAWVD